MMNEKGTPGMNTIRIAALCGSLRPVSYTRMALEIALAGARALSAETFMIDLRGYDLVFCIGKEPEVTYPSDVHRLREDLRSAQGIIIGTPEYHGSYSGVLKNALDLTGFQEFEGKLIGLVGVSGGALGASNALNDLRSIGRALHAWVIPEQVGIPQASRKFDAEGRLNDPQLEKRLLELGRQVARFAYLHCSAQSQAFIKAWQTAPANPGG